MKDDETKYSIEEVVSLCKTCKIYIISRAEIRKFKDKAGQSFSSIKEEIRQLRVENACADPELDYGENRKGYVYQFKKLVFERFWAYIKVKIKINKSKVVVVLSFHEEDLNYENN